MPVKSEARPVGRSENKASVELRFLTIYSFNCFLRMAIIIPTSQGVMRLKKIEKEIWEDKIGHGWLGRSFHVEQRKGKTWGQAGQCRADGADGSSACSPWALAPGRWAREPREAGFWGLALWPSHVFFCTLIYTFYTMVFTEYIDFIFFFFFFT